MMQRGSQPLYQRVKAHILGEIQAGRLKPNQQIPSESELVARLKVSRMTVNRALRELTDAGALIGVAGVGRFVADQKARGELLEIRNIADEIAQRGHTHEAVILLQTEEDASVLVAELLGLAVGERVFHTQMVHLENSRPLQFEDRFVNPAVAPYYGDIDLSHRTPHDYLSEIAPIQEAEHAIQAGMPSSHVRSLLDMPNGEPCLELFRRTWALGLPASIAWLHHPSSRYVIGGKFKPNPSHHSPLSSRRFIPPAESDVLIDNPS